MTAIGTVSNIVQQKINEKTEPIRESKMTTVMGQSYTTLQKVRKVVNELWNIQSAGTAYILSDVTSRIFKIGVELYEKSKLIKYLAAQARLISLFSIPFALYNTLYYAEKIAVNEERATSGIYFAQSLGWLADSTLCVLNVLKEAPVISEIAKVAVSPLMGVSFGANVINLCWNGYGIYRNTHHLKNFDSFVLDMEQNEFKELFSIDAELIKAKLRTDEKTAETELKNRIKSKIINHELNMLAIVIGGVGLAILIGTGGGVLAAAVGALGSTTYLIGLIHDIKAKSKFEAYFELPENKWQTNAIIIGTLSLIAIPVIITKNLIK
jgi:hypothetical protein